MVAYVEMGEDPASEQGRSCRTLEIAPSDPCIHHYIIISFGEGHVCTKVDPKTRSHSAFQ